jgi:O-acetyl-ADP-ribose deacetylase (regulator of RNase III)
MPIEYIVGDVLKQPCNGDIKVIPHCCNDIGVMGAGVAAAISKKYPRVRTHYQEYYKRCIDSGKDFLGKLQLIKVEDKVWVANMMGQHKTATHKVDGVWVGSDGEPPIRYQKLFKAMDNLMIFMDKLDSPNCEIHACKFGSDLAGGSWDIIEEYINKTWATKYLVKVCVLA